MAKIVIKKKVSLEFLGDEYKDAYLIFRSIPSIDYQDIETERKKIQDDSGKALTFILNNLKKYFIEGKFPNDNGELDNVDDLDGLDSEATIRCFQVLSGQDIETTDPKVPSPSSNPSTTEVTTPT